jgi:hypothetical protein
MRIVTDQKASVKTGQENHVSPARDVITNTSKKGSREFLFQGKILVIMVYCQP